MERLIEEIGDVPRLSRINFLGCHRFFEELVGNKVLLRTGRFMTLEEPEGFPGDWVTVALAAVILR